VSWVYKLSNNNNQSAIVGKNKQSPEKDNQTPNYPTYLLVKQIPKLLQVDDELIENNAV
jgi:hypothetical protein